jgi:LysM repeat protein
MTPSNPPTTDVTTPPASPTEYTIMSGDSYSRLANRFHVTVASLMASNPGIEPTKLRPGQKIKIPPPAPVAAVTTPMPTLSNGESLYSVKSGDTLSRIASEHHTTVKALRAANNLKTDSIRVGQKLTIPKTDVVATNGTTPKS